MAIQINGTTVVDNSRVLQNVGGLKTVGGTSVLGSGDIPIPTPSTAYDAVGTYSLVITDAQDTVELAENTTQSGSLLDSNAAGTFVRSVNTLSGTWRLMAPMGIRAGSKNGYTGGAVAVRIA